MTFKYNDGGMATAGFKKPKSDCVVRAIAIATEKPYMEIHDMINEMAGYDMARSGNGVNKKIYNAIMKEFGWKWVATMFVGSGCKVHLVAHELPHGRLMVRVSKHMTNMVDGIVHDMCNPSRDGTRAVYGYFIKELK